MRFILIILILIAKISFSQNLVPNGSFEIHFDCTYGLIENAQSWCGINGVSYEHSCNSNTYYTVPTQSFTPGFPSYQMPHSGNAYASGAMALAITSAQPSYPHVKLIDTLEAGKIYCVTYYVSLWNDCKYSMDKLGALFTATPFNCTASNQTLTTGYTPQVVSPAGVMYDDTLGWQEVSGSFIADGTEAYLTLGNFFTNAQHTITLSYPSGVRNVLDYYIDDVSVEEVQIAKARNDTLIYQGDSVIIGKNKGEALLYNWQPTAGLSCTNCPNPKASPSVTTTYTVTKTQCSSVTSDVITVTVSPVGIAEHSITKRFKLFPNPNNGNFTLSYYLTKDVTEADVIVEDITGKLIYQSTIDVTMDNMNLHLTDTKTGIYFVKVMNGKKIISVNKVIITN